MPRITPAFGDVPLNVGELDKSARLFEYFCQAEVQNLHPAFAGEFDICRFEIPVHDSFFVRGLERLCNLARDLQSLACGNRSALQPFRQRLALDQFQDQHPRIFESFQMMNRRDMGMIQRSQDFGLALEPRNPFRIAREFLGQDLDGNITF